VPPGSYEEDGGEWARPYISRTSEQAITPIRVVGGAEGKEKVVMQSKGD